ncbi:phospholipase D-like domain-containing protein DpdK [Ferrimonas senticii]|uniref:phospholipase D-like domain-containing protein DpdK n=1 Tax=Ferrimonas senticii TaxID=394566 RepID=UPI000484E7BE|nr:phospholipase D-like domain-containing protein DpdK [Ferrimonas senticii]
MTSQRQIFLHGPLGKRQTKEVIAAQLAALIMRPEPLWLVSPWISDFELLDNRGGHWDAVEPSWGQRVVGWEEVLACAINQGVPLKLVTRPDDRNKNFVARLQHRLRPGADLCLLFTEEVHSKGLLCNSFFLKGSMNFTYSGANLNDEHLVLSNDKDLIAEALLEFGAQYRFEAL